jgi:hypothetical protein
VTSYVVLFSREVLDMVRTDPSQLPEGFRIGAEMAEGTARLEAPSWRSAYVWCEDDHAPAELEGRYVELTLERQTVPDGDAWTRIVSRTVVEA